MDDPAGSSCATRSFSRNYSGSSDKIRAFFAPLQGDLKRTTDELDQVAQFADVFYDLRQRLGAIVNYLLRERGAKESGHDAQSTKSILDTILKELEKRGDVGGKDNVVSEYDEAKLPATVTED